MRERERLIQRIRQLRRAAAARDESSDLRAPAGGNPGTDSGRSQGGEDPGTDAMDARIAHLEALVEGLQDSVHREFERHSGLIAELEARLEPAALTVAVNEDARHRGL